MKLEPSAKLGFRTMRKKIILRYIIKLLRWVIKPAKGAGNKEASVNRGKRKYESSNQCDIYKGNNSIRLQQPGKRRYYSSR